MLRVLFFAFFSGDPGAYVKEGEGENQRERESARVSGREGVHIGGIRESEEVEREGGRESVGEEKRREEGRKARSELLPATHFYEERMKRSPCVVCCYSRKK